MDNAATQSPLSGEEIGRRGAELYANRLRDQVETDENIGKILMLDVETGNYEIDTDSITANKRLRANHPDTNPMALFAIRIGYNAVYAIGGAVTRTRV